MKPSFINDIDDLVEEFKQEKKLQKPYKDVKKIYQKNVLVNMSIPKTVMLT